MELIVYVLIVNYVALYVIGKNRYNSVAGNPNAHLSILALLALLGGGPSILLVMLTWRCTKEKKIPFIIASMLFLLL